MAEVRLYVDLPLVPGTEYELSEAASRYLISVMRLKSGDSFKTFNGRDGEFVAVITAADKKRCRAIIEKQSRTFSRSPDLWLLFAPLKKDATDFLVEKAVELGVRRLQPVITRYTNSEKVRLERFEAQIIEAAEQCRRVDLAEISAPCRLEKLLMRWEKERPLFFMDESGAGKDVATVFRANPQKSAAVLIGPEGGFSREEAMLLRRCDFVRPVSLGPRILRAETAAAAALSCWQAMNGDWLQAKGEKE